MFFFNLYMQQSLKLLARLINIDKYIAINANVDYVAKAKLKIAF